MVESRLVRLALLYVHNDNKTWLRTTMVESRLVRLALLYVHNDNKTWLRTIMVESRLVRLALLYVHNDNKTWLRTTMVESRLVRLALLHISNDGRTLSSRQAATEPPVYRLVSEDKEGRLSTRNDYRLFTERLTSFELERGLPAHGVRSIAQVRKSTLGGPNRDLTTIFPVFGSLVQHETSTLDHAATEAGKACVWKGVEVGGRVTAKISVTSLHTQLPDNNNVVFMNSVFAVKRIQT
uniref:Uncharacterized protein n=1 Tax=Timema monikensis TaxID=170555 RepID=A0A7R9HM68_9NEOP|nr:unnamed protein product [Timema monikensis]